MRRRRGAKEGKEKPREVLTRALSGDAALQGRPLLLLWCFQSILDPIFVPLPAMLRPTPVTLCEGELIFP